MTWAKLCGSFCFHRKVLEADLLTQDRASGAFARMVSWSAENLTSGKLSAAVALTIARDPKILDALVAVAMLEPDGSNYVIHDFGEYNPSGERLAAHREQLRARRSQAGRRGAAARWGQDPTQADPPARPMRNDGKSDGKPGGHLPPPPLVEDRKSHGKPPGPLPSAPLVEDGKSHGKPDGHLPSGSMADDGKTHGKIMPPSPSPSPSPSPPPTVVDFALTRVPIAGEATGETTGRRKSNARMPKHSPEVIAAKNRIVQTFIECFQAKKQVEPKSILDVDHAKAFELAERYGVDESCRIVRRAFEHDFVVRENATLRYIASRADTFRGTLLKKAHGPPEQQQVVGDEPWLREHLS